MAELNVQEKITEAKQYIGKQDSYLSILAQILSNLVVSKGKEIYFDDSGLQQALREQELDDKEVFRVCLMTKVPGLRELINKNFQTNKNDLERFFKNAMRETGLNRAEVLRLGRDIAFSLNAEIDYTTDISKTKLYRGDAYTIPASAYNEELKNFRGSFIRAKQNPKSLRGLDCKVLEPLVASGLPKAKYYLGYCLVFGSEPGEYSERGLTLLEQAAEAGDIEASAALGDYYYQVGGSDNWSKAYDHYTGYGAMVLTSARREAVTNIINHGIFNRKIIAATVLLMALITASTLIAPGSLVYGAYRGLGIGCILLELGVLAVMLMHYKVKPYDNFYIFPATIFAIHFVYFAIRVIF